MRLSWGVFAADEKGIAVLWRIMGALLLGVLLARWSWILFAPHATAIAAVSERGVAVEAVRLFGVTAAPQAETVALPNLQLLGVFAADAGKSSFAVLSLDGKQVGVTVGEKVAAGTKLSEVHADHVLLERDGVRHRINLETGIAVAAQSAPAVK